MYDFIVASNRLKLSVYIDIHHRYKISTLLKSALCLQSVKLLLYRLKFMNIISIYNKFCGFFLDIRYKIAPLTQTGLNSAGNLSPRIFAYLAGLVKVAMTDT